MHKYAFICMSVRRSAVFPCCLTHVVKALCGHTASGQRDGSLTAGDECVYPVELFSEKLRGAYKLANLFQILLIR